MHLYATAYNKGKSLQIMLIRKDKRREDIEIVIVIEKEKGKDKGKGKTRKGKPSRKQSQTRKENQTMRVASWRPGEDTIKFETEESRIKFETKENTEEMDSDIYDIAFRLSCINSTIDILASVCRDGTENGYFDREVISDSLLSATHEIKGLVAEMEGMKNREILNLLSPKRIDQLDYLINISRLPQSKNVAYTTALTTEYAANILSNAIAAKASALGYNERRRTETWK